MRIIPILLFLIFLGCNNEIDQKKEVQKYYDGFKQANKVREQKFKIKGNGEIIIEGKKGSKLFVDPKKLETKDGLDNFEELEISLIEATNKDEFYFLNLETKSDGKILESGGMYYIGIKDEKGNELKIKEGNSLKFETPYIDNKKMDIYYGEMKEEKVVNWKKSNSQTRIEREYIEKEIREKKEVQKKKSDIDNILDFINKQSSNDKEVIITTRTEKKLSSIFRETLLSKLEWTNIDKLLDENYESTSIICDVKNLSDENMFYAELIIAFKNKNSLIKIDIFERNQVIRELPKDEDITLFATSLNGNKMYIAKTTGKIKKDAKFELDFKESDEEEIKKILKKI